MTGAGAAEAVGLVIAKRGLVYRSHINKAHLAYRVIIDESDPLSEVSVRLPGLPVTARFGGWLGLSRLGRGELLLAGRGGEETARLTLGPWALCRARLHDDRLGVLPPAGDAAAGERGVSRLGDVRRNAGPASSSTA